MMQLPMDDAKTLMNDATFSNHIKVAMPVVVVPDGVI